MKWQRKLWLSLVYTLGTKNYAKKVFREASKEELRYFTRRAIEKHFVPKKEGTGKKCLLSPSLRYSLHVTPYETSKGYWDYTRGEVYDTQGQEGKGVKIADVKRNYSMFPFEWVEGHPDGHDYLVCGEDYQGQTVIQLDTGKRVDTEDNQWGFCWAKIDASPSKDVLAVSGCYWGGPYEVVLFDFADPMKVPHPEIVRANNRIYDDAVWGEDGSISLVQEVMVRSSDKKPYDDLSAEEQRELDEMDDDGGTEEITVTSKWDSTEFEAFRKKAR